jgi:hypothetical protein
MTAERFYREPPAPFTGPFQFVYGPEGYTIESAVDQAIGAAGLRALGAIPDGRLEHVRDALLAEIGAHGRTVQQYGVKSAAATVLFASTDRTEVETWADFPGTHLVSRLVTVTPWKRIPR